ncbi:MAG: hypothetical protein AAF226_13970, partial [Verrucomicrobiota bacterium]
WTFLGILLSSAAGWGMFCFAFFFLTAFLGRIRYAVFIAVGYLIVYLKAVSQVPLHEFSPFALLTKFGLERTVWPVSDLLWTLGIVAGMMAAGFVIGLVKEGSIAAMLGSRMSHRERLFMIGAILITVFSTGFWEPKKAEPFAIVGAVEEEWQGAKVYFSPEDIDSPVDLEVRLASQLAKRLAEERDWLGIPEAKFPDVYVVERTDIDEPEQITWDDVEDEKVVLMYADYRHEDFTEGRLLAWTLSQTLKVHSLKRVSHEDRWWIVCGLEGLWELQSASEELLTERQQMAIQAVKEHGLTEEQLNGWSLYQDEVEWRHADAVAWMGLHLLREKIGDEKLKQLARGTVVMEVNRKDSRAPLWDLTHPVKSHFQKITGMRLSDFVTEWREHILAMEQKGGPSQ